jgi:UDP-N-acetylmuramate dehydrogenase
MGTETLTRAQGLPEKHIRSRFFHSPSSMCTTRAKVGMRMEAKLRGCLRLDEPMARHVSWRAGGCVARTYQPADLSDLQAFLRTLPATEPIYFVGLGSNLLVRDGGLRGTVVFTHWALRELRFQEAGEELYAEAGLPSPKVARFAALHGRSGAEFLAGIPGTVGGALAMNAGCYGAETWEIVARVGTVDRRGRLHERTSAEFKIEYRHVSLKRRGDEALDGPGHLFSVAPPPSEEWFVSATFRLAGGDVDVSRHKIRELLKRRIATQPLSEPNAGSVFRNPVGDFAARLIEACGLKGHTIGDAMISPKHANFIINRGDARAADIEALIERAQSAVKAKFGIDLEREVKIIGERSA